MTPQELANLDLAVARAEGKMNPRIEPETPLSDPMCMIDVEEDDMAAAVDFDISRKHIYYDQYSPSTDPVEAMRLLVKYSMTLSRHGRNRKYACLLWFAWIKDKKHSGSGETPCIAISRAVVTICAANSNRSPGE